LSHDGPNGPRRGTEIALNIGRMALRCREDRTTLDFISLWVYIGITEEDAVMHKSHNSGQGAGETRLSVRIQPAQKALIARAARLRHTTLTEFILENALNAASQVVGDERHFEMTPEQFRHFCRALDAPPARNLKAMQRLLNEPSVLDE
jgi:uncharacterized protein (DUF1778 family)